MKIFEWKKDETEWIAAATEREAHALAMKEIDYFPELFTDTPGRELTDEEMEKHELHIEDGSPEEYRGTWTFKDLLALYVEEKHEFPMLFGATYF